MAISSGNGKTNTTLAALRGGYVDTLIVDSGLAQSLLKKSDLKIEK